MYIGYRQQLDTRPGSLDTRQDKLEARIQAIEDTIQGPSPKTFHSLPVEECTLPYFHTEHGWKMTRRFGSGTLLYCPGKKLQRRV